LDRNLPEGSENLLNAQESIYYSFYARLYEALAPVWESKIREVSHGVRVQPGDYTTNVDAVLDQQGNLIIVHQLASSSIDAFDRVAQEAWRSVGRFPNPPTGLLNPQGQVHLGFSFTVRISQGLNLESVPPERVY
jgi:hypothetical protein